MLRTKVVRAETRVVDAAAGRVYAVVSTEAVDRDGDIVRTSGWEIDAFLRHPVLLSSHDYFQLRSQIGEWEEMAVRGARLEGVARYYIGEGNAEADWGFKLAERGRAAYSVGFLPDMSAARRLTGGGPFGAYEFTRQELVEVSQVTVPSNPEALQGLKAMRLHPAVAELVEELASERPAAAGKRSKVAARRLLGGLVAGVEAGTARALVEWDIAHG